MGQIVEKDSWLDSAQIALYHNGDRVTEFKSMGTAMIDEAEGVVKNVKGYLWVATKRMRISQACIVVKGKIVAMCSLYESYITVRDGDTMHIKPGDFHFDLERLRQC